jgi:hypothetical protein
LAKKAIAPKNAIERAILAKKLTLKKKPVLPKKASPIKQKP